MKLLLSAGAIIMMLSLGNVLPPRPAHAFGFDVGAIVSAITTLQSAMNSVIQKTQSILNASIGDVNTSTVKGFQQVSNYIKGLGGAEQQISDGNNMVAAARERDVINAHIMDEHAVNRQDCLNLEGGQATIVAARKAGDVALALDVTKDNRTQAARNTPSWSGAAQGAQANNTYHFSKYCGDAEAEAGLCSLADTTMKGADQDATSLFAPPVYAQKDIDRANDYETTLIQPVAPAAIRGSAITSSEGQQALAARRSYNAAISLAHAIGHDVLSWHSGTVILTTSQKSEAQREGITQTDVGSLWEATELEVNRKYSGTDWQADLQAMPSEKSVLIQIAMLDAQRNWLLWQQYKLQQKTALATAKRLAIEADNSLGRYSPLPIPNLK
ncbi:MAG: hypothetical protein ABF976_11870 [Acetobacter syzygii]|uniref:hypothetical protein n=1 Tax=Acetobacter syzygii TaxID=146476 RepID=UPI000BA766D5|nr:hypothetical protein [Acetobacter syzygii]NSL92714.1 hypothetical protein [Acetobacter syzygii]PAL21194.1 hypothetical protein B9K04_12980 [Acetobacter syzygii]